MSAPKPALPINRHFDCMKKCPMDCTKACKRLAYPQLVAALRELVEAESAYGDQNNVAINQAWEPADRLLRSLGEL